MHQEVIKVYEDGKSLYETAAQFQVSPSSIYYILKKYDIKRRSRGATKGTHNLGASKIPFSEVPKIIDRYNSTTDTLATIASDYQVTRQAIDELLKRNNIHKRKYTPKKIISDQADIDMIIRLYNEKRSYKSIADEFGCSSSTIRGIVAESGIEIRRARKISDADHSSIADRYANGEFMAAIAKDYNVVSGTISVILKKQGVKTRRLKKFSPKLYGDVYQAIGDDLTYKEISTKLGIKLSTVAFIATKAKNLYIRKKVKV